VAAGRYVNWVGVAPSETWTGESWTEPGDLAEALADFAGWSSTVTGLIAAAEGRTPYRWALYDRDPLDAWSEGPVTLLGDACHPMLPFMAQGAAQAIEDAAVLVGCLDRWAEPAEALQRYEDLRRDRTARVQLAARSNETMFHLPDGPDQLARDTRLSSPESRATHRNAWLFDYDAINAAAG
ncbi:MAG: FAD-dependent monooxygenase, partial [Actinomycetota bacterium]|nr:FAD-dependent monooxygenase [Actinomycetota bacterium]